MAAATVQLVPPLVVFLFLQGQFMKGIAVSGGKDEDPPMVRGIEL